MRIIWKFELLRVGLTTVLISEDAEILQFQEQNGGIVFWAIVDPEKERVKRAFRIVGTGWPMGELPIDTYMGTVQVGNYVWHIFEEVTDGHLDS